MLLKELMAVLEEAAPFSLQDASDNSGIQLGDPDQRISRGLVCLDVTPEVVEEARKKGCDLILSHHPLLYEGLKRLTGKRPVEQALMAAIRHGMAVVSVHTNLDFVSEGLNRSLAGRLGLTGLRPLSPATGVLRKLVTFCPTAQADEVRMALFRAGAGHIGDYDCCSYNLEGMGSFRAGEGSQPFVGEKNTLHMEQEVRIETIFPSYIEKSLIAALIRAHPYEEVAYDIYPLENPFDRAGAGMIGLLEKPLSQQSFLSLVKEALPASCLKHSPLTNQEVRQVAVCGGSGGFLLDKAMQAGVDAYLTAELKHHQFLEARGRLLLIDAGHYETEQLAKQLLLEIVNKKIINFALLISEVESNPAHYF